MKSIRSCGHYEQEQYDNDGSQIICPAPQHSQRSDGCVVFEQNGRTVALVRVITPIGFPSRKNKRLTVLSRLSTRSARLTGAWRVPKTPFVWKAELGGAPDSAFSAQLGSVTYYAVTRSYGHPAYIEVRGARRGLKRLDLGTYVKLEQAKQACERHYRAGC